MKFKITSFDMIDAIALRTVLSNVFSSIDTNNRRELSDFATKSPTLSL